MIHRNEIFIIDLRIFLNLMIIELLHSVFGVLNLIAEYFDFFGIVSADLVSYFLRTFGRDF